MNERMKGKRQELKISQAQLAQRIGVSRQTVNMIESGEYNPTLALCIRICHELGCTLNDLFWNDVKQSSREKDDHDGKDI